MKILFASSEVEPFSKTGGLADVAGALPGAMAALGHDVLVVTPRYKKLRKSAGNKIGSVSINLGRKKYDGDIFESVLEGGGESPNVPIVFIANETFFDRDELYSTADGDYPDNYLRFAFFSKAVLEAARFRKFQPDVIHINDWQTALIPVYLKTAADEYKYFSSSRILVTLHNMGYHGNFPPSVLQEIDLPENLFTMDGIEFWGKVDFLKGGIIFSNAINTVSEKYAREIQESEESGAGLNGVLKKRSDRVFGILNGVDYSVWNPQTDKYIAEKYSVSSLNPKKACKKDLTATFGLEYRDATPVIGVVSRLAGQKGFDLIEQALPELMVRDLELVILGTGEKIYHDFFESVKNKYRDKLGVKLAYDNAIAHKTEAGADFFLMPSKYEPCGLNQMFSLKYGTVPIVRATGGLDDTVDEWDGVGSGVGFKFADYTKTAMMQAIDRALITFGDAVSFKKIMINGMKRDHSWSASAKKYSELYEKMSEY